MRTITTEPLVVDGCRYHIAVVLSGSRENRYTTEWWRDGDAKRVRDEMMFDQSYEALAWAQEQIRKTHHNAA